MNIKSVIHLLFGVLIVGTGTIASATGIAADKSKTEVELKPLRNVKRILFLGDSITYAGGYVDLIDAYLFMHSPNHHYELINSGLPSETVSGLSEINHAGGAFPRPDLHERLDRALAKVKPDLVVACYGMNDGIYAPLDAGRFAKYKEGIHLLADKVKQSGAKLWVLTPPVFDSFPIRKDTYPAGQASYPSGHTYVDYDLVLEKYGNWLLDQRKKGWKVTDIHTPLKTALLEQRAKNPDFVFAGDGVHLNDQGHKIIAIEVLKSWGAPANSIKYLVSPEESAATDEGRLREITNLVIERQHLLTDAWLNDIGHKRLGMAKGLSIYEAEKRAAELESRIRDIVNSSR